MDMETTSCLSFSGVSSGQHEEQRFAFEQLGMNVIAHGKCCFGCVIPVYCVGQHKRMTVTTLPLRFLLCC